MVAIITSGCSGWWTTSDLPSDFESRLSVYAGGASQHCLLESETQGLNLMCRCAGSVSS